MIDEADPSTTRRLDAVASTLLPGNEEWPDGASLDLGRRMLSRATRSPRFQAALDGFGRLPQDDPATTAGPKEWHAAMSRLQAHDPDLFGGLLMAVYDAYYTHPAVTALVARKQGVRPGPPLPEGHVVQLEPSRDTGLVRAAGVRWRDDEEPIARTVRAAQETDPDRVWDEEEIASWSR